jgi:2-polyprenyl-6-methoxyphenol hydroxylase-like FAD-dependent oxidoreductase
MPVSEQEVPVLVVGGSLVGLTTSVLLASHGVRHMLIESHRGTAIHPRAAAHDTIERQLRGSNSRGVKLGSNESTPEFH